MATKQKKMEPTTILSRAPTRIDLAGGTIDLWPLYLFLQNPVTLNVAIDLFAEAKVDLTHSSRGEAGIILRSEDQNMELKLPWTTLHQISDSPAVPPQLELHFKLLRYFEWRRRSAGRSDLDFTLSLSTRAKSPAGAGLGGSSTLSVAIVGALAAWVNGENDTVVDPIRDGIQLVEIVRDIETTVIQVPAGVQDYYGAMFGGLQSLRWNAGSHQREWLPEEILSELESRLLLFYSGHSRNSGINNWALFKGFIDKQDGVREKFAQINQATHSLETALRAKDWKATAAAIEGEWSTRRTLAPGITTPEIDQAFERARKISPVSGKICGAGGGGCFFLYLPDKSKADAVRNAVVNDAIRSLPFRTVRRGLEVRLSRA